MQKDYYPELATFEDVARHYLQERASEAAADTEWFASRSQTLPEAMDRACAGICASGLIHPHQWRPFKRWPQAPKRAADLVKPLASQIADARNFDDDLHPLICITLARVTGIGPLACYDIAHRIGAWLRPKLEPTEVYLHRGTREGAKAVIGRPANRGRAPMSDFPEGLRALLAAAQLEDVLCIYRGTLARIAGIQVETFRHGISRCVIPPAPQGGVRPGRC